VKPQFIVFIGEKDRCRDLYKIGFVQGPQKMNDASMKMIHPGTTVQG
jgi:hypothetical protein